MSLRFLWLALASLLCVACSDHARRVEPTEIVVRVYTNRPVDASLASLRVRVFASTQNGWSMMSSQLFSMTPGQQWPVDIVVVPKTGSSQAHLFEVIIDGLDAHGTAFAQQRQLATFVPQRQAVLELELWLDGCQSGDGNRPICETDDTCHGGGCSTCVAGRCGPVPTTSETTWLDLDAGLPDAAKFYTHDATIAPTQTDARVDASVRDASTDAAEPPSDGCVDSSCGEPCVTSDSGKCGSDAALSPPVDAGPGPEKDGGPGDDAGATTHFGLTLRVQNVDDNIYLRRPSDDWSATQRITGVYEHPQKQYIEDRSLNELFPNVAVQPIVLCLDNAGGGTGGGIVEIRNGEHVVWSKDLPVVERPAGWFYGAVLNVSFAAGTVEAQRDVECGADGPDGGLDESCFPRSNCDNVNVQSYIAQ